MESYYSFLLGGVSVAIIVLIAWLSSNLMRAERVIMEVNKETKQIENRRLIECATYPYLNTYMGLGMGYPFWFARPRSYPYFVTV